MLTCETGYKLNGSKSLTCQQSGQWNNAIPHCKGVSCPTLPKVDNALPPTKLQGYRYPETLKITCETGYKVEGSDLLQCNSSGKWGFIPQCKVDQNPQEISSLTGIAVGLGAAFALLVVVICVIIYIRRRRSPDDKGRCKPLKDPKSTDVYAEVSKRDEIVGSRHSLQITTNGAIYNNEIQKEETREYYSFAGDLKISETAISMNDFYDYVDKGRGTKGPIEKETIESTINDFWRMIWQYDCGKIVMLTNVFELGKPKCKQYWPDPETKTKTYGSTEIVLIDEDVYSDFTIRTLKIVKENHSKTVKQFHFTAWPDKDVPKYASSIVHFRHKVLSSKVSPNGPIIIHCSAGIGRTGTFIALDYIVNEANESRYIDVFKCVETLRRQRVNMVQTARQYVFLHEAILEAVMCPNSGIPSKDFPDLHKKLMLQDSSSNKSNLQLEYQRMNAMCEKHEDNVFDKGKIPENRKKNRDSTILPVEYEMPILSTFVEGHNEYINAVFLPGYKNKKAFIVTQMPLDHTKIDLWRLVYDHNIQTIVMLNQVKEDTEAYWPENQETPIQIGAFKIELRAMESKPYCNCLHLTFKYKTWDERSLVMYQANFWNDNAVVPDSKEDLFNLLFEVENKSNNGDDSPILVHCLNGCDKSGLYCVLATVLERLRIEQDIDIQHIIKQTRNKRPQIILNYEQFRFIYDAVLEYLKQFETYANFQ
ncbi:Phosphatidylinositol phosphatase PTPRQ,Tyrosine-protein phosphatase non-receptor type 11 [Mytilus edulis]|uniref:protein-tyrosine-phosphatase n=1 Tax=Mytilus edulis TaxID=6550 RepID=A0A8S3SQ97_MYTED|nr:Phosphatidylinositol phosphatase PTPRQ,Tyrosine-protein phosphatase non-receptor type 11 [Mytilus edulis]